MNGRLKMLFPLLGACILAVLLAALIPVGDGLWAKLLTIYGSVEVAATQPAPPPECIYDTPWVKSIWPALVELNPFTLELKDAHSTWEITKANADPYGDYAWGLSGEGSASNPLLHFLHTICSANNGVCVGGAYPYTSVFHIDLGSGHSNRVMGLDVSAFGLAEHEGQFYFATSNVVVRDGGGQLALPEVIGGLDFVDGNPPYLLAITRQFGSHVVWRIDLDGEGNPIGPATQAVVIDDGPGSPLEPYAYTGVAHAVITWQGVPTEVLYVSKDDGTWEPWDVVAIVEYASGRVLRVVRAVEGGVFLDEPIVWPNGVASLYINWANPQGLQWIDGRLFLISRYYWNKGPLCLPE
jgi:hypothetical protein